MNRFEKNITKSILVLFWVLLINNSFAQYTLTDNDVVVTNGMIESCSYDFSNKDIIIPSELDGQTVTGIIDQAWGQGVFSNQDITSVRLPNTLKYIGNYAFQGNEIAALDLSNFTQLDSIGSSSFVNNYELKTIDFTNTTKLVKIKSSAFSGCSLNQINLTACVNLEYIGAYSFRGAVFTEISLNNLTKLEFIGSNAFYNNSLTSVSLNGCTSLVTIQESAFSSIKLTEIILPTPTVAGFTKWISLKTGEDIADNGIITDFESAYHAVVPHTLTDDEVVVTDGYIQSCSYNYASTDIIIPEILDGQTILGIVDQTNAANGLFAQKGITTLQLPSTFESIGQYAFYGNLIAKLELGHMTNLTVINSNAFTQNNITHLDLSTCTSLERIESSAFYYNTSLSSVLFPKTNTFSYIGYNAFGYGEITDLDLSNCTHLTDIEQSAFIFNDLESIDVTNCTSLELIGEGAFQYHKLTNIDLSTCTSLRMIEKNAFAQGTDAFSSFILPRCTIPGFTHWINGKGESLDIEEDITDFSVFYNAVVPYTLTDDDVEVDEMGVITSGKVPGRFYHVIIPSVLDDRTVTGIASEAYKYGVFRSDEIVGLKLPETLQYIGSYAFQYNPLTILDLSDCNQLESIYQYAFYNSNVPSVDLSGCTSLTYIYSTVFNGTNPITEYELPTPVLEDYVFNYWYNSSNEEVSGVVPVSATYRVNKTEKPDISFIINDTYGRVNAAQITIEGFETVISNSNGYQKINNVTPNTTLNYTVSTENHEVYYGTLTTETTNFEETVTLELAAFDVTFVVTDVDGPVALANITLGDYETVTTNPNGVATISSVLYESNLSFTITSIQHESYSGNMNVSHDNTTKNVLVTKSITGISDLDNETKIHIYPNPFTDQITLTGLENLDNTTIEIMNMEGVVVSTSVLKNKALIIDESLDSGTYLVRIRSNNKTYIKTIIKE